MRKNPKLNIMMSAWYLDRLVAHYNSVSQGLAHYNGGHWQGYRYGLLNKQTNGKKLNKKEKTHLSKLAKETEGYVPRILDFNKSFKEL